MEEYRYIPVEEYVPSNEPEELEINPKTGRVKKGFWNNWIVIGIEAFLIMIVGDIGIGLILGLVNSFVSLPAGDAFVTGYQYFTTIGVWIAAIITFLIFRKTRPLFHDIGFKNNGNTLGVILFGTALGAGMNLLCAFGAIRCGNIQLTFNKFEFLPLFIIFVMVLIQYSSEELICRCFFLRRMTAAGYKPVTAVILNSAFFGALHLANSGVTVLSIVDIIIFGLLESLFILCFDSFWGASFVHAAWNFTQNIILGLPNSGMTVPYSLYKLNPGASDGFFYTVGFGIEGSVFSIIVQVLACAAILLWWVKKHPKQKTEEGSDE